VGTGFQKLKFGFVNLTLDFLEEEDLKTATGFAANAKALLQNEMGVDIVESAPSVNSRAFQGPKCGCSRYL
jgi:hypothetical protein